MSEAVLQRDTGGGGASLAVRYRAIFMRRVLWLCILAAAVCVSVVLNIGTGPSGMSVAEILSGLIDPDSLDRSLRIILWEVRLPIAMLAVVVGACLGLAGAEMQTILNNPLASPSTLGVMHAATVGASLSIVFNISALGIAENYSIPIFAFAGAMGSIFMIHSLSRMFGTTVDTVILFGIATVFAMDATVSLVQFVANDDSL